MDGDERAQKQRILDLKKRRKSILEEQRAIKGISTPPEVIIEIEELEKEIVDLARQLIPPPPIPRPPQTTSKSLPEQLVRPRVPEPRRLPPNESDKISTDELFPSTRRLPRRAVPIDNADDFRIKRSPRLPSLSSSSRLSLPLALGLISLFAILISFVFSAQPMTLTPWRGAPLSAAFLTPEPTVPELVGISGPPQDPTALSLQPCTTARVVQTEVLARSAPDLAAPVQWTLAKDDEVEIACDSEHVGNSLTWVLVRDKYMYRSGWVPIQDLQKLSQ